MIQIIYASAATQPFTPVALKALLAKARTRNTLHGVSGMLLYRQGSFLQVLEGPEIEVERILASIYKDKRHTNTRLLSRTTILKREFEAWSMGFHDTSHTLTQPAGQIDYLRLAPTLQDAGTTAKRYLRFFQEGMYRQGATASPACASVAG